MKTPRRVLVIEDEDDIRRVARVSLERIGRYEVLVAASGADGLRLAREARPDAILCDVQMPELDGPETLRRLRACPETAAIPLLFLTAQVMPQQQRALLDLGAAAVLAKPFDPLTLPRQIAETLGWQT